MKTTLFSFDEWFTIFEELLICDYFESLAYCDMRFDNYVEYRFEQYVKSCKDVK